MRLRHGWTVHGPRRPGVCDDRVSAHRIVVQQKPTPHAMMHVLEREFLEEESSPDKKSMSQNDKKFLDIVSTGATFCEGRFEIPLPFNSIQFIYSFIKNNSGAQTVTIE